MTTGLFRQVTEPGLSERAPNELSFYKESSGKENLFRKKSHAHVATFLLFFNISGACPGIFFDYQRLFLGFFLFGLFEDGRKEEYKGKNGGDYSCFGGFGPKIVLEL